jgi:hypothetical protein
MARKQVQQKARKSMKRGSRDGGEVWTKTAPVLRAVSSSAKYTHHKFIQNTGIVLSVQGLVAGQILDAKFFALSQIPNYGNLVALYDDYQIEKVEVTFSLRVNPGGGSALPRLSIYPDFDDATAPPSIGNVFNHPRVQQHAFSEAHPEFKICVEPRVSIPAYQGAFTGYTVAPSKVWVDCANAGVQHYGIKYGIENFTDTNQYLDVYFKFFLAMRNPL